MMRSCLGPNVSFVYMIVVPSLVHLLQRCRHVFALLLSWLLAESFGGCHVGDDRFDRQVGPRV